MNEVLVQSGLSETFQLFDSSGQALSVTAYDFMVRSFANSQM
jgi:hypothetical protein